MKTIYVLAFVVAATLAGCSKKKADTTPTNTNTDATTTTDGNATGGSTYGATPTADPCAGTPNPCAGQ